MPPLHHPLTRAEALQRLAQFVPKAGRAYAARRNRVDPDGRHEEVSRLSAALRRRVISEAEVVRAVLAAHGYTAAQTFIAEVFWRTYFKGWLEARPAVWAMAQANPQANPQAASPALAREHAAARAGATGIAAFDHWAGELRATGYLHNWARMQMASIWIFTLKLPWEWGAAWFYEQLLDADPASNTLSWRWVAGLHTPGKAYLANAERIAAMTGGRLAAPGLATRAQIPAGPANPPAGPLRMAPAPDPAVPSMVLVTSEDGSLEQVLQLADVRAVAGLALPGASAADRIAIADGVARAAAHWGCEAVAPAAAAALVAEAGQRGCTQIVTGFAAVGPVADALAALRRQAAAAGITLAEHLREWDRLAWPHCTRGFFQLRNRIPALLQQQGIAPV